jgi:hypothetical protein
MTGSEMRELLLGFGVILPGIAGVMILIIGAIVSLVSFQWWIFAIAGVLLLTSGIGWWMTRAKKGRG